MATNATEPPIGINALPYYIKRIYAFLESDKKTLSFPKISQELQDVLIKITENTEFLFGDEFSDNVQIEVEKLAAAINTNVNIKLTHEICNGKLGSNVLMYKKIDNTFKVPEPLRKPSFMKPASFMEPPSDGSVTQIFKTNCLNAATKFVKDDSQLVMRFPEMVPAQAEFVMDMILPGKEGKSEKADVGFGYRSVYAPLWESMRLFSLKYKYEVNYDKRPVTKYGMMRIVFEKIPKSKTIEIYDSDRAETPEVIIVSDDEETLDDSYSTSSSAVSINDSKVINNSKRESPRENKSDYMKKVEKLIHKLSLEMQGGQIQQIFVHDALELISGFLMDDQQQSIVFDAMSQPQSYFLANVKRLSSKYETYMLFTTDCQKFLDNIKYCINKKNVQYRINYAKGKVKSEKGSLKTIEFEKISSKTSPKTETLDNSSFSSQSATSVSTSSGSKKGKLKQTDKVVARLLLNIRKGFLTEEYIETVLRRISEFMIDEQQASVVFHPKDDHHLQFIQKAGFCAREEGTYRVFTNESQKLLRNINSCFKKNNLYHVRQFKGTSKRDVVLEKLASFESNYEKESSLSSVSTATVNTNTSAASSKKTKKQLKDTKTQKKAVNNLYVKMRTGVLAEDFIQATLQRIADFMYEAQGTMSFQNINADQLSFITHVETIARDETWYSVFRNNSRKLLADINRCFKRNMLYQIRQVKGRKDVILEKIGQFHTKEPMKEKENNENVNNTNTQNLQTSAPISQLDHDLLIRLKAIKDTVASTCGEQAITLYLKDISNFLTQANTDRYITFEDMTESEALFLKHAHMLSKLEAGYAMFSRDCQKYLKSIQFNAKSYKLKFQMIEDVQKENHWMVILEKQFISPNEKKEKVGIQSNHHNAIKDLYEACRQTLEQKDQIEQQRARSLSAGRRTQQRNQSTANVKADATARGSSTQRLTVKEKLKAALAQPVHSDKALRMMECMGWKGGALGLRGEGIIEPIELPLDLVTRAGLGHVPKPKNPKPVPRPKKQKPSKQEASSSTSQLPHGFHPVDSLSPDVLPPGVSRTDSLVKCKTVVINQDYVFAVLRNILEIIKTDLDEIHFVCMKNPKKVMGFLNQAVTSFNKHYRFDLGNDVHKQLVAEITHTFHNYRGIKLNADIRNKTELYPPIVVIKKTKLIRLLRKKILKDEVISLIDDEEEIMDTEKPTINDQPSTINNFDTTTTKDLTTELTMMWYEEQTNDQESKTTNEQDSTTDKQSTTSGRQWYLKLKSKRQHKGTTETPPELKLLALSAICKLEGVETDIEIPKTTATKVQSKTDRPTDQSDKYSSVQQTLKQQEVRVYTKKTKSFVITNMTRKLLSLSKQQSTYIDTANQQITKKKKRKYKRNNIDKRNDKVNKNSQEMYSFEPKRTKMTNNKIKQETTKTQVKQESKTTETKIPPGVLLLQKLTINNNSSTMNKNGPVTVKKENVNTKSSVSVRLPNAVANSNITVKKENEPNNTPAINNVAPIMNNNAPTINNGALDIVSPSSSNKSKTGLICKSITSMKIVVDGNTAVTNKTDIIKNDSVVPVESKINVEKAPKNNITETLPNNRDIAKENNIDLKENGNKHTTETKNVRENDLIDEDDECEIIFDSNSSIEIDSEDEKILLISDDEIEIKNVTNNKGKGTCEEITKAKDTSKKALEEKHTSRKILKATRTCKKVLQEDDTTDEIENGPDNYYDAEVTLLKKPALIQTQERKRPSLDLPKSPPKKCKLLNDFKKLCILPKDYPQNKMYSEKACEIQSAILKSIDYTQESLPFFKCQGIQNGGLIYSCQDEKSLLFLERVVQSKDDLKIVYEFDFEEQLSYKMAFRINSFIEEPVNNVLNRIELCNTGLNSTKWNVIKKKQCGDFAVISIEVDEASFNYICEANFVLYAGNDCARFTIMWN